MAWMYWLVHLFVCLGSHSCHHRHYIRVFVSKTNRNENCVHFVFIHRLATFRRIHRFMHCIYRFNECEKWHKQTNGQQEKCRRRNGKNEDEKVVITFRPDGTHHLNMYVVIAWIEVEPKSKNIKIILSFVLWK